jgi:hypothetical protein
VSIPVHSVTFWLNAFIPRDIAAATTMVLEGEYRGLTALSISPCYLTDQRNFSNELRASSRMHSLARIDISASEPVLTQYQRCDDLIECDPVSGEVIGKRRASASKMKFTFLASDPRILIRMECRYCDPLMAPAHGLGEIEYKGTIEIDPAAGFIGIDLMICLFPAFEGYAAIDNGPPAVLFRHAPAPGILALGPPRGAQRRIRSQLDYESFSRRNSE